MDVPLSGLIYPVSEDDKGPTLVSILHGEPCYQGGSVVLLGCQAGHCHRLGCLACPLEGLRRAEPCG